MPSGIAKGGTYRLWLPSESARYHCEAVVYKCALRILRDLIQSTCSSKFSYIFPCIRCIQCILNNLLHFIIYTLLFSLHFYLLYLHNILYTRNVGFHICTLNSHAYQISLTNFYLSNIPLLLTHYTYKHMHMIRHTLCRNYLNTFPFT